MCTHRRLASGLGRDIVAATCIGSGLPSGCTTRVTSPTWPLSPELAGTSQGLEWLGSMLVFSAGQSLKAGYKARNSTEGKSMPSVDANQSGM